eukprot:5982558-Prymnesium_polylepis.1
MSATCAECPKSHSFMFGESAAETRTFSSFTSRWMMPCLCTWPSAAASWEPIERDAPSDRQPCRSRSCCRSPPGTRSSTSAISLYPLNIPRQLTMLRCGPPSDSASCSRSCCSRLKVRSRWPHETRFDPRCPSLQAYSIPVCFSLTTNTAEDIPSPSRDWTSKHWSKRTPCSSTSEPAMAVRLSQDPTALSTAVLSTSRLGVARCPGISQGPGMSQKPPLVVATCPGLCPMMRPGAVSGATRAL